MKTSQARSSDTVEETGGYETLALLLAVILIFCWVCTNYGLVVLSMLFVGETQ